MQRVLGAVFVVCALLVAGSRAEAQWSAGGLLGWATDFKDDNLNRLGFNLGGRFGYTLSSGAYVGGTGIFFIGENNTIAGVDTSWRNLQLGAELGYDIGIGPVIVRPYAGLGLMFAFVDVGAVNDNATDLYLNFGGTVIFPISRFFVGGDLRFAPVFADDTYTGFVLQFTAGYAWGEKPHDTGAEIQMRETERGTAVEIETDDDEAESPRDGGDTDADGGTDTSQTDGAERP